MKKLIGVCLALLIVSSACTTSEKDQAHTNFQTVSALGDTLFAPALSKRDQRQLNDMKKVYEQNSKNLQAIVHYSAELSETGRHKESVQVYTEAVNEADDKAQYYLLRGKEYISLRKFDEAISDFEDGSAHASNQKMNKAIADSSRMNLTPELHYQMGVVHYLRAGYGEAQESLEECLNNFEKPEMGIAASFWLYMALRRAGKDGMAGEVLEPVTEDMDIRPAKKSYYQLLLVFKGVFKPDMLLQQRNENGKESTGSTIIGYGLGNWHYINGRKERARELFRSVYESKHWDEPAYIAAERDLHNLFGHE